MKNHRYAVVIEKGRTSCSAYVPDLPVCVAVAKTEAGVRKLTQEAIAFHIRGLREDGDPVPRPKSVVDYVEVPLAS
jgi:predicted RNase H-like HicB family nuclease